MTEEEKLNLVLQYGSENGWKESDLAQLSDGHHPEAVNDLCNAILSGKEVSPELARHCVIYSDD